MLVVCIAGCLVGGCAPGGTGSVTTTDCATQARWAGAVYTGYGATGRAAARVGTADLARCEDVGRRPRGSVFLDDPPQVAVWSVRGYPTDQVLAVRRPHGAAEVLLADDLPRGTRERILRDLAGDRG